MTLTLNPPEVVAVLRRATLDERDRLILRIVWQNWRRGMSTTYRELMAMGLSLTGVRYRVGVYVNDYGVRKQGLMQTGWLRVAEGIDRRTRPGPRLAGFDHGWPLERIEV